MCIYVDYYKYLLYLYMKLHDLGAELILLNPVVLDCAWIDRCLVVDRSAKTC